MHADYPRHTFIILSQTSKLHFIKFGKMNLANVCSQYGSVSRTYHKHVIQPIMLDNSFSILLVIPRPS